MFLVIGKFLGYNKTKYRLTSSTHIRVYFTFAINWLIANNGFLDSFEVNEYHLNMHFHHYFTRVYAVWRWFITTAHLQRVLHIKNHELFEHCNLDNGNYHEPKLHTLVHKTLKLHKNQLNKKRSLCENIQMNRWHL